MDLNTALRSQNPPIAGSTLTASEVTNTNANANATAVTIPGGALGVYVSTEEISDGHVWFLAAGATAPVKGTPTPGRILIRFGTNGHPGYAFFPLDPSDPPTLWIAESAAADQTFHFLFVGGTK